MKKIIFFIALLLFIPKVNALDIHLFYSELCSTCEEEIEFLKEYQDGMSNFKKMEKEGEEHLVEKVGDKLRSMFSWIKNNKIINRDKN